MSATDWVAALDELELEVERAERLAATSAVEHLADWVPPTGIGPLPHSLLARARALADRQQAVIARLTPMLDATRHQLQVGRRISGATTQVAAPVYVDVTA